MEMMNMDAALDVKPTVYIEGKQLQLLKIDVSTASVGESVQMCCMATIQSIRSDKGEDGLPTASICFELSNIELEEKEDDPLTGMYPNSPKPA